MIGLDMLVWSVVMINTLSVESKAINNKIEIEQFDVIYEDSLTDFHSIIPHPSDHQQYIILGKCAVYTFNISNNTLAELAGHLTKCGYKDGKEGGARFNDLRGGIAAPDDGNSLLILDMENSCIRRFHLQTVVSSVFAGKCTENGNLDGDVLDARLGKPSEVTGSVKEVYIYDKYYKVLKRIKQEVESKNWVVESVIETTIDYRGISCDSTCSYIYFTYVAGVGRLNLRSLETELLISQQIPGYLDGGFSVALVDRPGSIHLLTNDTFLIADMGNSVLRLANIQENLVTSVCHSVEASARCSIRSPTHITAGQRGGNSLIILSLTNVYQLHYKVYQPKRSPAKISESLKNEELESQLEDIGSTIAEPVNRSEVTTDKPESAKADPGFLEKMRYPATYTAIAVGGFGCLAAMLFIFYKYQQDGEDDGMSDTSSWSTSRSRPDKSRKHKHKKHKKSRSHSKAKNSFF